MSGILCENVKNKNSGLKSYFIALINFSISSVGKILFFYLLIAYEKISHCRLFVAILDALKLRASQYFLRCYFSKSDNKVICAAFRLVYLYIWSQVKIFGQA